MKAFNGLVVALVVCAMTGIGALGCNTFRGAGKDIQQGGRAVENAADDAQNDHQHQRVRSHSIVASAESGGSIRPSGSTSVSYGSNRTYTIRAYGGFHVADVVVDGRSIGPVSRYTFSNVTESHTITAFFNPNSRR